MLHIDQLNIQVKHSQPQIPYWEVLNDFLIFADDQYNCIVSTYKSNLCSTTPGVSLTETENNKSPNNEPCGTSKSCYLSWQREDITSTHINQMSPAWQIQCMKKTNNAQSFVWELVKLSPLLIQTFISSYFSRWMNWMIMHSNTVHDSPIYSHRRPNEW